RGRRHRRLVHRLPGAVFRRAVRARRPGDVFQPGALRALAAAPAAGRAGRRQRAARRRYVSGDPHRLDRRRHRRRGRLWHRRCRPRAGAVRDRRLRGEPVRALCRAAVAGAPPEPQSARRDRGDPAPRRRAGPRPAGVHIFLDLTVIAVCGGVFVVPLYAIIQRYSEEAARARTIAAMNIMNALFMAGAAVITALLLALGFRTPDLWLVLGILNAGVALWICRLLPQDTLRMLARIVLRLAYRVEVQGLEHLAAAGERAVIVPNHVSYLDGPLIAAFLPGYPMFAIDTAQAAKWWARPLLAGR